MAKKIKKKDGPIVETVKTVVYALLIAGLIRTLLFQPFWIPSGSMKSTLLIGDFLFVNKFAYGYSYASCPTMFGVDFCGFAKGSDERLLGSEPERGDVVVFKHPVHGADFIKRLIGLPGDRIQVIDSVLHINGVAVELVPDGVFTELRELQGPQSGRPQCINGASMGEICEKERFIETLPNGVSHTILNFSDTRTADHTREFIVPDGHYFFMGDNRDNSVDSRFSQNGAQVGVGFVPLENIIGRADRIIFSSAGSSILAFWTWRSDRYFKAVN
ncbi:MAG: signal peptidase I [Rhodobacteraceae bacterium]|nr:signal peptidase I [Paracoccaceae bacterium]